MDFKERKDFPMRHLFELGELNVYDTKVINLSAGTPSEALLKNCNSLFKEATDHRLVCMYVGGINCFYLWKLVQITTDKNV